MSANPRHRPHSRNLPRTPAGFFGIVDRYVLRQVFTPLATALVIGLVVLLAERMLGFLDIALGKQNFLVVVFSMLAYLSPNYIGIALPAAIYLGVLFGFSRLSQSNQLEAFLASGIGVHRLARPLALLALLLAGMNIAIVGWLQPYGRYAYRSTVFNVQNVNLFYLVNDGVFMKSGSRVFILDELDRAENRFGSIFIFDDRNGKGIETVTATNGSLIDAGKAESQVLRLEHGQRLAIEPQPQPASSAQAPNPITSTFERADTPLASISNKVFRPRGHDERELTLGELFSWQGAPPAGTNERMMRAEMHNRILAVVMIPMLPFLALTFALAHRRNRSAYRFGAAIILLITFYVVVQQGAILSGSSGTSPFLTMWLPFLIVSTFAAWRMWNICFRVGTDPLDQMFSRLTERLSIVQRILPFSRQARETS
jgi:lipopolysaccharide export system permease protein